MQSNSFETVSYSVPEVESYRRAPRASKTKMDVGKSADRIQGNIKNKGCSKDVQSKKHETKKLSRSRASKSEKMWSSEQFCRRNVFVH